MFQNAAKVCINDTLLVREKQWHWLFQPFTRGMYLCVLQISKRNMLIGLIWPRKCGLLLIAIGARCIYSVSGPHSVFVNTLENYTHKRRGLAIVVFSLKRFLLFDARLNVYNVRKVVEEGCRLWNCDLYSFEPTTHNRGPFSFSSCFLFLFFLFVPFSFIFTAVITKKVQKCLRVRVGRGDPCVSNANCSTQLYSVWLTSACCFPVVFGGQYERQVAEYQERNGRLQRRLSEAEQRAVTASQQVGLARFAAAVRHRRAEEGRGEATALCQPFVLFQWAIQAGYCSHFPKI